MAFFLLWNFFLKKAQASPGRSFQHVLEDSQGFQMVLWISGPYEALTTIFALKILNFTDIGVQNHAFVKNLQK